MRKLPVALARLTFAISAPVIAALGWGGGVAGIAGIVSLGSPAPVQAIDFVVTRYDDPFAEGCAVGNCSLREAIQDANAAPGLDRVLLSAGSYELTRFGDDDDGELGDLDVFDEVEIVGPGATMTQIDAAPLGTLSDEPVLQVFGTATVRGITLTGSHAEGIKVSGGNLTLLASEIKNNDFQGNAAGVSAAGGGTIVVRDSAIINNGSGLNAVNVSVTMENVTLTRNGQNQIIVQNGAELTCIHCTVLETPGGNPEVRVGSSTIKFQNSIVRGECEKIDSGGVLTSLAGNVESPGHGCGFTLADDRDDIADPGLSALGDHGGPTRTFDLVATSPAVDLVEAAECSLHDQRGVARSFHFQLPCDAGAVERVILRQRTPIFADGFQQSDGEAWSSVVGG
ncbi:MAG: choice-of-anchor Q domain-containing protein [Thermoanaerobaculia bacterium]